MTSRILLFGQVDCNELCGFFIRSDTILCLSWGVSFLIMGRWDASYPVPVFTPNMFLRDAPP